MTVSPTARCVAQLAVALGGLCDLCADIVRSLVPLLEPGEAPITAHRMRGKFRRASAKFGSSFPAPHST